MSSVSQLSELERRASNTPMMDVLIRITLVGALAILCYQIFSPFLTLTCWSVILAVTLYPFHQWLARRLGRKQWLASTILIIIGLVVIITPVALLLNSFADSVRHFIGNVQQNTLHIPPPRAGIENWPLVGKKIYGAWYKAHSDLPGFVQSMQPKISQLAQRALAMVASIGKGLLLFLASFIVAGILMAYGEPAADAGRGIFVRVAGAARGEALFKHPRGRVRRYRRRIHSGNPHRVGADARRRTGAGRFSAHCSGSGDCTIARRACHASGHHLHLVER